MLRAMSVSAPGDPGAGQEGTRPVHVDHAQKVQVGDHNKQDNRVTQLHLHFGDQGEGASKGPRADDRPGLALPPVARSAYLEQVRRIAPPALRT